MILRHALLVFIASQAYTYTTTTTSVYAFSSVNSSKSTTPAYAPSVSSNTNEDSLARVKQWSTSSPMVDAAFDVLCKGGTVLCPTIVGYSLFALDGKEGAAKLDKVKGRENKPYGVVGSEATFSRLFSGRKAPLMKNDFCSDMFLSFVSSDSVSNEARDQLRISRAVGPSDEVAMWINSGPIFDTIIEKVEAKYEGTRYILVSSGNLSGNGNPKSSTFSIDAIDDDILARVDMVVDTPHWSDPELDENGRWYSAPMFDMDSCAFRRVGKNMETASVVLSLFHEIDVDNSQAIDMEEFKLFFKSGQIGKELANVHEEEVETMFQLIDKDESGEIDFEEMYSFLSSNKSVSFNIDTIKFIQPAIVLT